MASRVIIVPESSHERLLEVGSIEAGRSAVDCDPTRIAFLFDDEEEPAVRPGEAMYLVLARRLCLRLLRHETPNAPLAQ